jgi:hypothetical protein
MPKEFKRTGILGDVLAILAADDPGVDRLPRSDAS